MFAIELTPERPVQELTADAVAAEAGGFDAVFAAHHYNNRDQFVALSSMAQATESIAVGPGIANPYETHPVTLASRVATLDEVSGGRAIFGVGPGDASTLRNLGFDHDRPLRRVLETFEVARRLWRGERVDHDGTFQARDAGLNYEVGEIPVYVGAQGPHMTRMGAKRADGVLYNGAHPKDLAWAAEQVGREVERSETSERASGDEGPASPGRNRDTVDLAAYASVSVAEDESVARDAARMPVAFITAGAPDPVLDRHDLDRELADSIGQSISAGSFREAGAAVSESMIDAFSVAGTPETVAERTDALLDHADSVVFASPLGPDVSEAIDLLAGALDRSSRG